MKTFVTRKFTLKNGTRVDIYPFGRHWAGSYCVFIKGQPVKGHVTALLEREIPRMLRYEIAMKLNPKLGKVSDRLLGKETEERLNGLKLTEVIFDEFDNELIEKLEKSGLYESQFTDMVKDIVKQAETKKLSDKQRSAIKKYMKNHPMGDS